MSATTWRRIQLGLTLVWLALIFPSVIWWSQSISWLVLMSCYANVAGSAAGWMAARSEESAADREDVLRVERKIDALLSQRP